MTNFVYIAYTSYLPRICKIIEEFREYTINVFSEKPYNETRYNVVLYISDQSERDRFINWCTKHKIIFCTKQGYLNIGE